MELRTTKANEVNCHTPSMRPSSDRPSCHSLQKAVLNSSIFGWHSPGAAVATPKAICFLHSRRPGERRNQLDQRLDPADETGKSEARGCTQSEYNSYHPEK